MFNALLSQQAAEAANYPFCTIEPNVGRIAVPDVRQSKLAEIAKSAVIIPNQLEFVDIAGLVRGASKGEGLGNKFLAHIREVDAVMYVLRCFENGDMCPCGRLDRSAARRRNIEPELTMADLESLERRSMLTPRKPRAATRKRAALAVIEAALSELRAAAGPQREH